MAELFKKASLFLMSEHCYDNYFLEYNFTDVTCFKALLSKGLGLGIIAGSLLVKVPQILKLVNAKSSEGISIASVLLDLMAITFHMSYSFMKGFPFSSWGDTTFLALQTALIAALVFFYNGQKSESLIFCIIYAIIVYVLNSGMISLKALAVIQAFNIPILLLGKFSQAWTNFINSSTGQLSAATLFMLFAGSLARIFTSIQETGDRMMIITFCASTFANAVLVAQLLYYWNKDPRQATAAKDTVKKMKGKKAD